MNDTIKQKASEASFTDLSCGLQAGGHVWTRQRADRYSGSGRKIGITEVTQGVRSKSRRAPDRGLGGCGASPKGRKQRYLEGKGWEGLSVKVLAQGAWE